MPKTYYITNCSDSAITLDGSLFCECTFDQVFRKKIIDKHGRTSKHYACKEHGGLVVQRKIYCKDCGIPVHFNRIGRKPFRCPKCQAKVNAENNILAAAKRDQSAKKEKVNIDGESPNMVNCRHFETLCGFCIQPYFECRMYRKAAT